MDDDLEFPQWMIQYSEALKTAEKRKLAASYQQRPRVRDFLVGEVSGPRRNLSEGFQPQNKESDGFQPGLQPPCSPDVKYQHLKQTISSPVTSKPEDGISGLQTAGDIAFECERLLNRADATVQPLVLGLDLDWPSTYTAFLVKTSSIHLCYAENSCLLFEVGTLKKLPVAFTRLINHPNVRLLGHNIIEDLLKLGKDFDVNVKQVISSNLIVPSSIGTKLSCEHNWSWEKSDPLERLCHQGEDVDSGPNHGGCVDDDSPPAYKQARFEGEVKYCTTFQYCAEYCEALLVRAASSEELVLGFDLEWPFSYKAGSGKAALIQICPDESICYIFHVFALKFLPKALVVLLTHPKVRLTGLNIANDVRKLGRDFKVDLSFVLSNNLIELSDLANAKLGCQHRWSLAGLVANQLRLELDKGSVRVSNWSRPNLSTEQLQYAATDAYSVCRVGVFKLGKIPYGKGLEVQKSMADALKGNSSLCNGGALLLLEHHPVYTVGIRSKAYTMEDKARLESLGAEFHETDRGGLITFHGPGQLVAYPVINLKLWKPSVKWYIQTLEDVVIDLCAKYDVEAHRYHPYPGIWVGEKKICAVGVHASRFVTTHGIAVNCNTDMNWFKHIVPCGIEGKGVTSLSELLARDVTVADVIPKFLDSFKDKFPCELIDSPSPTP